MDRWVLSAAGPGASVDDSVVPVEGSVLIEPVVSVESVVSVPLVGLVLSGC
nr:hypothetical protein JVH1_3351 [Rhodococcus sp. JVH1]